MNSGWVAKVGTIVEYCGLVFRNQDDARENIWKAIWDGPIGLGMKIAKKNNRKRDSI